MIGDNNTYGCLTPKPGRPNNCLFVFNLKIQGKENGDGDANDKKDQDIPYSEELNYCVKRLVKGLASSRKRARHGFATVLTEILSEFRCLTPEVVLGLITKHLTIIGSAKAAVW